MLKIARGELMLFKYGQKGGIWCIIYAFREIFYGRDFWE